MGGRPIIGAKLGSLIRRKAKADTRRWERQKRQQHRDRINQVVTMKPTTYKVEFNVK